MLSHSFALYRQARTFSSLTATLCFRVCSSKLCKTVGFTKHHKPQLYEIFPARGGRSNKFAYRGVSTVSCYFKESGTSAGEQPSDTVKDETSNISDLHSDFYDEDAKISSRQPKPRSVVAEYKLDENGYMNIQDLVDFLKKESAIDICVIKTSGIRRSYVDYFVVVSGVSTRHIRAMAKNLEQLFRGKVLRGIGKGGHPVVEGMESNHWVALDIGNIVVHFFLPEVREVYELEKLWTLGPKYDDQSKAFIEEERFRQATEYGIKLDKPVTDELDEPVVEELGLDDPRRY